MKSIASRLIPYFFTFLLIEALVRLSIGIREFANLANGAISLAESIFTGVMMDVAAFLYILPFLVLIQLCLPRKLFGKDVSKTAQAIAFAIFVFVMIFTFVSEWLFWDELTSRFNFIAVDYLIYMDEVVGNIRESYPLGLIIAVTSLFAAVGGYFYSRRLKPVEKTSAKQKLGLFAISILLAFVSFFAISEDSSKFSENRYNNELAKNGIFSLFSAFRNNELSYTDFYINDKEPVALANLREQLASEGYAFTDDGITRRITAKGKEIHPNVVLITVESLSAEYLGAFGNPQNLTPFLDKLSKESLFFSNLYATGTRTVYGLSSITLSIPPSPGNAIARRPENDKLFSLGSVLNSKGYDSKFIYGGFGYFDNMNTFFSGNGYQIVDRSNLSEDEITFANIWGVSDGDIFARTLKESDESYAKGKPFFNMIMTTSNHQPFTYPAGKIEAPSGSGRFGAVKYTDYAIGEFINEAKKHAWFDNTIFVIVADHTAGSSGKLDLTPDKHHIPMFMYAPKLIKPQVIDKMTSQIDLAPTLLGLMNMKYDSRFYGRNALHDGGEPRAFIGNYQYVGLLKPDSLTVLKPGKTANYYNFVEGEFKLSNTDNPTLLSQAVAYFQNASLWKKLNHEVKN